MVLMQRYYPLFLVLLLPGCQNTLEPNLLKGVAASFKLITSGGKDTDTFAPGEDIYFEYTLENHTGKAQPYVVSDAGPIVTFVILEDGKEVGNSSDGFAYAQVVVSDTLGPESTAIYRYNWLSVDLHIPLAEGDYVAKASPRLTFADGQQPPEKELAFRVVCQDDCDTTKSVRLTDLPKRASDLISDSVVGEEDPVSDGL